MEGMHPHDALLQRMNGVELFQVRKMSGMWGGCDWNVVDADPEAIVVDLVARERVGNHVDGVADLLHRQFAGWLGTAAIRIWSRTAGADEEPVEHVFPVSADVERFINRPDAQLLELWAACEAIAWERGEKAVPRPTEAVARPVVGGAFQAPPTPKPVDEMTEEDVRAWAKDFAERIFSQLGLDGGQR